ncbi:MULTISPECIES: metal-dependent hydrolase [Natrialbaceae]|uniref:metal-dependent hydrolase n=1 Tax=Natrialbaceae TaxID=1644061 RepID=UPI00207D6171|nr:metal-dependent hydrolase [Natronococcus sp. CG52]
MYPWEHAAVAYLLYAGYTRWRTGTAPAGWAVLVVLFASQLPDLLDKPLAWQFALIPSGRSLAHSVFVAVPLALVVLAVARRHEATPLGVAFTIGSLSHLATDAVSLYPGGSTSPATVLWPLVSYESATDAAASDSTAAAQTGDILLGAYPSLVALEPTGEVLVRLGIVGMAGLVWVHDGRPGVRELTCVLRWAIAVMAR